MGGPISAEQTVEIIDSIARATHPMVEPVLQQSEPWWQIFAIVGGTITALLTAWGACVAVKKRKK